MRTIPIFFGVADIEHGAYSPTPSQPAYPEARVLATTSYHEALATLVAGEPTPSFTGSTISACMTSLGDAFAAGSRALAAAYVTADLAGSCAIAGVSSLTSPRFRSAAQALAGTPDAAITKTAAAAGLQQSIDALQAVVDRLQALHDAAVA